MKLLLIIPLLLMLCGCNIGYEKESPMCEPRPIIISQERDGEVFDLIKDYVVQETEYFYITTLWVNDGDMVRVRVWKDPEKVWRYSSQYGYSLWEDGDRVKEGKLCD